MSKTSMFVLMGDLLRKDGITSKMKYCKYSKTKNFESISYVHDVDVDETPVSYSITSCNTFIRVDVVNGSSNISFTLKNVEEFLDWCNGDAESTEERMKRLSDETHAEYERLASRW